MSLTSKLRTVLTLGRGVTKGLPDATADRDPIALFREWFAAAKGTGILLPDAMMVATCTKDGLPSARMMLLKDVDERGFVFYTNYTSRKSDELLENPEAALVFHWPILQRQVRVEGAVQKISEEESRAYFATRSRGSRIGAWASKQSATLPDRGKLKQRAQKYERQFSAGEVPLPPFWGGFRLTPRRIEFWQGRLNRLHDRLCFTRDDGHWKATRLYP